MKHSSHRGRLWAAGIVAVAAASGAAFYAFEPGHLARASEPAGPASATPVSVAVVEPRNAPTWDEFSGRLEAIERVDVRSRVAGMVQAVHFREGAMVKQGDLLVTIDPAPYAAEVDRAEAQVAAAKARLALTKSDLERGQQLVDSRTVSLRDLDQRTNAYREAEANLRAVQAALQSAKLNLDYTQVRAPVAGRVGKLEITVGNLLAAGPGAPVLTTLVSLNPIYASFNADEQVVMRALKELRSGQGGQLPVERIPVRMTTANETMPFTGRLQLIDNQVDAKSGTVRVRAVFDNADGRLMPGQFARLGMGQIKAEPALVINERAVGTDQDKKFVLVVGGDNKATYREITLGPATEGLRVVTKGLKSGERIVVNGLQRVRPGALVEPQMVSMNLNPTVQAQNAADATATAQR